MWVRGLVALAACVVVAGCSSGDKAGLDGHGLPTRISCGQVASQAVDASADQDVHLLKVRDVVPVVDNRGTVSKPASGEALVLSCEGVGVYSDGENVATRVRWVIDSDGTPFVYYRGVR